MSTSTLSSDFESDVISIDDHQMNALIRSDGCNSIEIEFDKRSSADESSPRKQSSRCSSMSEFCSPVRKMGFRPIGGRPYHGRSLFTDSDDDDSSANVVKGFRNFDNIMPDCGTLSKHVANKQETVPSKGTANIRIKTEPTWTEDKESDKQTCDNMTKKTYFKSAVSLKQDLGDEGIVQLVLPGHRVSIANVTLDDDLVKSSSNVDELIEFISKAPELVVQTADDLDCKLW